MLAQRWDVTGRCRTCRLELRVDLRATIAGRGPGFSLWNRTGRCKKVGCYGVVEFHAKAPGMAMFEQLVHQERAEGPGWAQRRLAEVERAPERVGSGSPEGPTTARPSKNP